MPLVINQPVYTFRVNTLDYSRIYSQTTPNILKEAIYNQQNFKINIPGLQQTVREGQEFTLSGDNAIKVYNEYFNIPIPIVTIIPNPV
jgi:hypothetical protein